MSETLIKQVDALLPQTQCELCTYKGCLPYAKAIVEDGEAIDLCLPGGVRVLEDLGDLFAKDVSALKPGMELKQKSPSVATIREAECIGCTKCIQACPVDAIVGAAKRMHTVITDACNGCELCLPPCPVDCIDITVLPVRDQQKDIDFAAQSRKRFDERNRRIQSGAQRAQQHLLAKKSAEQKAVSARQQAIAEILQRKKKTNE